MRKLRLQEVQQLAQGHTFNKRQRVTSDLSQIQIAQNLSLTPIHAAFLIRCKTVEMTEMENKKGNLRIIWPCLTAQSLLVIFSWGEKLEHLKHLLSIVPDVPRCFSLPRNLCLCGFLLSLEHTAFVDVMSLRGTATAFPIFKIIPPSFKAYFKP